MGDHRRSIGLSQAPISIAGLVLRTQQIAVAGYTGFSPYQGWNFNVCDQTCTPFTAQVELLPQMTPLLWPIYIWHINHRIYTHRLTSYLPGLRQWLIPCSGRPRT